MKNNSFCTWFAFLLFLSLFFSSCRTDQNEVEENKFIYAEEGRLYFPDGEELALWGVNLQPCLSWEYNSLFKLIDVPLNSDTLKLATDNAMDEIQKMNCDLIRCHLVPSDYTDDEGNLVETIYLDQLDYMVAEAARRGMYVYLSFLNPNMSFDINVEDVDAATPTHVENSFLKKVDKTGKRAMILDEELISKSQTYIKQLLNRKNPYLGETYKNTAAMAVWEIMNEPLYYSYEQFQETYYYDYYLTWIKEKELQDNEENYKEFRYQEVKNYIDNMYEVVRETGAVQPVVWNCNWHRMIRNREDVFKAIAESKVEVVSFCNYPGQSILKRPYTKNPEDLSRHDFAEFLKNSYTREDWYGWALSPEFKDKAKVVYEFETFYNYSGYLYPAQANFFRAMGAQMASMWHYSMPRYAPYRNGSHHLSLTSTPHKAAAYAIAGELFRSVPLYHDYDTSSTTEQITEDFMFSYEEDLSIFSSDGKYMYSGDVSAVQKPAPPDDVEEILGYGSSPLVSYSGKGIYTMRITDEKIELNIEPDAIHLKPLWGKDWLESLVTKLDYESIHNFKLKLDGWNSDNSEVYRLEKGSKKKIDINATKGLRFKATPGKYEIVKISG